MKSMLMLRACFQRYDSIDAFGPILCYMLVINGQALVVRLYLPCSLTEALEHKAVLSTMILLVKSMNSRIL